MTNTDRRRSPNRRLITNANLQSPTSNFRIVVSDLRLGQFLRELSLAGTEARLLHFRTITCHIEHPLFVILREVAGSRPVYTRPGFRDYARNDEGKRRGMTMGVRNEHPVL